MSISKQENGFPLSIEDDVGMIQEVITEEPGVYFVFTYPDDGCAVGREMYIVDSNSPLISNLAKKYGTPLPHHPQLLQYLIDSTPKRYKIIEFELARNRLKKGLPLKHGETIRSLAIFGMEEYPDYFGIYPAPVITPYGHTIRYRGLSNGIYWIETDQLETVLALCNVYADEISEYANTLSATSQHRPDCPDDDISYLFFPMQASCIPLYELLPLHPHWLSLGWIRKEELMNSIYLWNPEYAISHNLRESAGMNDGVGMLLNSLGEHFPLRSRPNNMISLNQQAKTNFCSLFE